MSDQSRLVHGALLGAALGLLMGCRKTSRPQGPAPRPSHGSASEIPRGPVTGTLRDVPFALHNARYFVETRAGYEHIDLHLNQSTSPDPCGSLATPNGPRVWLRRTGSGLEQTGETRLPSPTAPWSAHYQLREANPWVGNGDATGLVVIRNVGVDGRIQGSLSLCFDDGFSSCVAGTFSAVRCPDPLAPTVRGNSAATPARP